MDQYIERLNMLPKTDMTRMCHCERQNWKLYWLQLFTTPIFKCPIWLCIVVYIWLCAIAEPNITILFIRHSYIHLFPLRKQLHDCYVTCYELTVHFLSFTIWFMLNLGRVAGCMTVSFSRRKPANLSLFLNCPVYSAMFI